MLTELVVQFGDLPAAYITIHQPWKGAASKLDFNIDTPTDFEQWRIALGIAPDAVSLHPHSRESWVAASTVRDGITIHISAHGISLTEDQLSAPRIREDVAA
jgi:hypothetical protein